MKTLVVVDIQPEYKEALRFDMYDFVRFVNECDCDRVLVLYNGEFTLGMISEDDLKFWYESKGDEGSLSNADYHDKGYAFFRSCMDHGFADDVLVPFIRYMWLNNVTDSRDVNWEEVEELMAGSPDDWDEELVEFLREEQECLFVPDLMDVLNETPGELYLVGGGVNECLREVIMALEALERPYTVVDEYTY